MLGTCSILVQLIILCLVYHTSDKSNLAIGLRYMYRLQLLVLHTAAGQLLCDQLRHCTHCTILESLSTNRQCGHKTQCYSTDRHTENTDHLLQVGLDFSPAPQNCIGSTCICSAEHLAGILLFLTLALPPVLADTAASALLALSAPPPVLTDDTAPALLAVPALPPVLACGSLMWGFTA